MPYRSYIALCVVCLHCCVSAAQNGGRSKDRDPLHTLKSAPDTCKLKFKLKPGVPQLDTNSSTLFQSLAISTHFNHSRSSLLSTQTVFCDLAPTTPSNTASPSPTSIMSRAITIALIVMLAAAPVARSQTAPAASPAPAEGGLFSSLFSAATDMAKSAAKSALNSTLTAAASGETVRPNGTRAALAGFAVPLPLPFPCPCAQEGPRRVRRGGGGRHRVCGCRRCGRAAGGSLMSQVEMFGGLALRSVTTPPFNYCFDVNTHHNND